jgi:uncharacterized membrane protein YgcG
MTPTNTTPTNLQDSQQPKSVVIVDKVISLFLVLVGLAYLAWIKPGDGLQTLGIVIVLAGVMGAVNASILSFLEQQLLRVPLGNSSSGGSSGESGNSDQGPIAMGGGGV